MSTPMTHHPLARPGPRRLTWLLLGGLAIAGVTIALVLTLSASKSPSPVRAVPVPAAVSPAPNAGSQAPDPRLHHGLPPFIPRGEVTPSARYHPPLPGTHGLNQPGGR